MSGLFFVWFVKPFGGMSYSFFAAYSMRLVFADHIFAEAKRYFEKEPIGWQRMFLEVWNDLLVVLVH